MKILLAEDHDNLRINNRRLFSCSWVCCGKF